MRLGLFLEQKFLIGGQQSECTAESGKVGRKQEPAHEGLFKEVRQ